MIKRRVKCISLSYNATDDKGNENLINEAINNIENYPDFERILDIKYINHLEVNKGTHECGVQAIIEYEIDNTPAINYYNDPSII